MRKDDAYAQMGGRGGEGNYGYNHKLCSLSGRLD